MKQDFNDSVDSMLRDYARRVSARESFAGESRAPQRLAFDQDNMEHLDADEITAFAENALPAAARARTVAHLADCNECRQFVVALTNAENISSESVNRLPPQIVHARLSLRERFAAFFASHLALRYAVPAFAAVLFVALIAGVILNRHQPDATLVASKQESQTIAVSTSSDTVNATNGNASASSANLIADSAPVSNTATTATTDTTTTTTTTNAAASSRRAANANAPDAKKESTTTSASQNNNSSVNAPLVADLKPQPAISDKQRFDDDAARVTNRSPAAAAPPSASMANANMSGNSAGVAAGQNEQINVTSNQDAKAAQGSAGSKSDAVAQTSDSTSFSTEVRAASRRRATSTTTAAKKPLPVNGRAATNADSPSAAPSALRRINGRDFRRQGTRWIDAAYVPSQSTTNLTRGSKQYLTVVGAEPGIGKIAAQLDGEIIVVWKGRAYRIR